MEFKFAAKKDFSAIKNLWACSFESYEPYFSWYFNSVYQPKKTLCCFDTDYKQNVLLADLQFADYKLQIRDQIMPITFFVGVITNPLYRGKHIGEKLMKEALQYLYEHKIPLACLYPEAPVFYQKLGFEYCYEETQSYLLPQSYKNLFSDPNWKILDNQNFADWDWKSIDKIYRQQNKSANGWIVRRKKDWFVFVGEAICDQSQMILYSQEENPQAYLLLLPKKEYFLVREFAGLSPTQQSLLETGQTKPSVMGRIIDAKQVLQQIRYPKGLETKISYFLKDDQIKENNGHYLLTVANQKGVLESANSARFHLGIPELTSMVWGYRSATELAQNNRLFAPSDQIEILDRIFPKQINKTTHRT